MTADLDVAIARLERYLMPEIEGSEAERALRTVLAAAKRSLPGCPKGCGCVTEDDPDARECACDGPCTMDPQWPDNTAQRPPLADATRERLAGIIDRFEQASDGYQGVYNEAGECIDSAPARAILAEFRPVASTRERLADFLRYLPSGAAVPETGEPIPLLSGLPNWDPPVWEYIALGLIESGAVEDRAEVEARTLEAAGNRFDPEAYGSRDVARWLDDEAASIREGRS